MGFVFALIAAKRLLSRLRFHQPIAMICGIEWNIRPSRGSGPKKLPLIDKRERGIVLR